MYEALLAAGLAPMPAGKIAKRKPSMKLAVIQEFFELYVSNTGSVFKGTAHYLNKDKNGTIVEVVVNE